MKKIFTFCLALLAVQFLFAQPVGKKILVEKISSVGCPGCSWGGYLLDSLAQNDPAIIPVAFHANDQWHVDSMATPAGDSVMSIYRWGTPTAMVDRVKYPDYNLVAMSTSHWKNHIETRKLDPVLLSIGASSAYDFLSRQVSITVNGAIPHDLSGDIRLNVYIMESPVIGHGLGYDQFNGYDSQVGHPLFGLGHPILNYQHKYVLRDMLADPWGQSGVIPDPALAGSDYSHTFSGTLDTAWNESNCYLIALVQRYHEDMEHRDILNAVQLELNDQVLADLVDPQQKPQLTIFPQPMKNSARLLNPYSEATSLQVFDISGKMLRQQSVSGEALIDLKRESLSTGIYFVQLRAGERLLDTQKLMVN